MTKKKYVRVLCHPQTWIEVKEGKSETQVLREFLDKNKAKSNKRKTLREYRYILGFDR